MSPGRVALGLGRVTSRLRVVRDAAMGRQGAVIQQATPQPGLGGATPVPRIFDFGDFGANLSNQFYALGAPAPENVEWLFLRSDEWSRTVVRLTSDVWRQRLEVVPTCQKVCSAGHPVKTANAQQCPDCGSQQFRPPDPAQRQVLEAFAEEADRVEHDPLDKVGRRKTMEMLKQGRSYIVYHYNYEFHDGRTADDHGVIGANGTIRRMWLEQVHVPATSRFHRWVDAKGRPGGKYACLRCRNAGRLNIHDRPVNCAACGGATYEVPYFETGQPGDATPVAWYAPWEVDETKWPYEDGSAPIARLWPKAAFLLLADWYAAWALDPARDKRPDKIVAFIGGKKEDIKAWIAEMNEMLKKEPYSIQSFHIPFPPGGIGEFKADIKVLDLGETNIKGALPELRKEFESAILKQYHRAPVQGGDVQTTGGLNQEGLQVRVAAEVVEDLQRTEEAWPTRLAKKLGVTEFTYRFPPALKEDEGRVADVVQKELANAEKAAGLGLAVKWEEGRAVIQDGPIRAPAQAAPSPFGTPPSSTAIPGEAPFLGQAEPLREAVTEERLRQAAGPLGATSASLPGDLEALFAGPSGAVAAADAAWQAYEGLTQGQSARLSDAVVRAMANPAGWNTRTVTEAVLPILAEALGQEAAPGRAAIIARTEPRAIASEWLLRLDQAEQARRGESWLYDWAAPEDQRTTKLSLWLVQEARRRAQAAGRDRGLPLEEFLSLTDDGIARAQRGDFAAGGALAGTPGQPVILPASFRRRGFAAHFGERGRPVRVGVLGAG